MIITRSQSAGKIILLSYLTGVYFGDGYCTKKKCSQNAFVYIWGLTSIDEDFVQKTQRCIESVFGLKGTYTRQTWNQRKNPKWSPTYQFTVYSKRIYNWFTKRTKFKTKIPRYVNYSYASKLAFLVGVWDSEGFFAEYNNYKDRHNQLRPEWTRFMCGIAATDPWIHEVNKMMISCGASPNKMQTTKYDDKPGREHYKPIYCYRYPYQLFIKAGLFFNIERKMARVRRASLHCKETPPVNLIDNILRDQMLCSQIG